MTFDEMKIFDEITPFEEAVTKYLNKLFYHIDNWRVWCVRKISIHFL